MALWSEMQDVLCVTWTRPIRVGEAINIHHLILFA